jgi:hypothetical protein
MKCERAQTFLLQAERLESSSWPDEMATHVKACAACHKIVKQLRQLENAWRNDPIPEEAETSKIAFLKKLSRQQPAATVAAKPAVKPVLFSWRLLRWSSAAATAAATAAMLLIALGVITWLLVSPGETRASDVVERLIDWNLELTNADAKERQRLFEEHEANFKRELEEATLSPEDRQLAEKLLEAARGALNEDDPADEANRLNEVNDRLLDRINKATIKGDEKDFNRCSERYHKIWHWGIVPLKDRLSRAKMPEPKKKGGWEQFANHEKQQEEKMKKMWEHAPPHMRPEFRKAFEAFHRKDVRPPFPKFKK